MAKGSRKAREPSLLQKLRKEARAKVKNAKTSLRKAQRDLRSLGGRKRKATGKA
jgi:hypothetical protein